MSEQLGLPILGATSGGSEEGQGAERSSCKDNRQAVIKWHVRRKDRSKQMPEPRPQGPLRELRNERASRPSPLTLT